MELKELIDFNSLFEVLLKCKNGVLYKNSVSAFYINSIKEITKLLDQIQNGTYKTADVKLIKLYSPKERLVESKYFRDRLVQRAFCDFYAYPEITKTFIKRNYACQKNKGIDPCIEGFVKDLRHYYLTEKTNEGYVAMIDFRHYFANISKTAATEVLRRKFDEALVNTVFEFGLINFISNDIGIYGGGQLEQLMGIAVPNRIDHAVESKFKITCYARYQDDLRIVHRDKGHLQKIIDYIREEMSKIGIQLHPKKTFIQSIQKGIPFLGKVITLTKTGKVYVKLKREAVRRIKTHFRNMLRASKIKKTFPIEYVDKCFNDRMLAFSKKKLHNKNKRKHRYNTYHLERELREWYRKERRKYV